MSRIHHEAEAVLIRVVNMAKLIPNVERHLLEDQHDAIGASSGLGVMGRSGHSDPTPGLIARLAPFAYAERRLLTAIARVDKALNDAEREVASVLNNNPAPEDAGIRCPGWNAQLRAQLGGCGKPIEHWTDSHGVQHNRSTLLCQGCRRAEERTLSHDE